MIWGYQYFWKHPTKLAIELGRNFLHKTRFYPANTSGSQLFRGYVDWMVEFQRPYKEEVEMGHTNYHFEL